MHYHNPESTENTPLEQGRWGGIFDDSQGPRTGCYEWADGLLDGGIEGRILKFSWRQTGDSKGPAVMVFTPDGQQMFGLWCSRLARKPPETGVTS